MGNLEKMVEDSVAKQYCAALAMPLLRGNGAGN